MGLDINEIDYEALSIKMRGVLPPFNISYVSTDGESLYQVDSNRIICDGKEYYFDDIGREVLSPIDKVWLDLYIIICGHIFPSSIMGISMIYDNYLDAIANNSNKHLINAYKVALSIMGIIDGVDSREVSYYKEFLMNKYAQICSKFPNLCFKIDMTGALFFEDSSSSSASLQYYDQAEKFFGDRLISRNHSREYTKRYISFFE